jgi:hypothetical protein
MDARIGGDRVEAKRTLARLAEALASGRAPRRTPRLSLHLSEPPSFDRRFVGLGTAERDAAHSAVTAFVVQLRESGVPPQRMLVDVKNVAREASTGLLDTSAAGALVEDVVRWSVEAFYRR